MYNIIFYNNGYITSFLTIFQLTVTTKLIVGGKPGKTYGDTLNFGYR